MKVPENPFRPALANMYMEKCMGKPEEDGIKRAVNGNESDLSLDYYIGAERMINHAIMVFRTIDHEQLHGAGGAFSKMLGYVSYEIERLSASQNED
jgi:hypothetical protein